MNLETLKVLYEDNHLIVVVKPSGVLSQEDNTKDPDMLSLIKQYLKEKYNKPGNVYLGLVHRLDRMTGGVMVFAKTSKAASRLSEQIRNHEFEKSYLAVTNNRITKKHDNLIDYILVDEKSGISKIDQSGKKASLEYKVIKEVDVFSLLDIKLHTGRHHQIRIQFASRGYPLYGDMLYGNGPKISLSLYAYSLKFYHPVTKEQLVFEHFPTNGIWEMFN
ncbi:MAG: RluA family pseudouridine synthase [Bacilli bacterium]|nr:RluA family pseudouridine synthase [Bacilli bacterium]